MNSDIKLHRLKNPYKDTNLVAHNKIRKSAIRALSKLHKMEVKLPGHWNWKLDNIFSENKKLKKLIEKESLTKSEFQKVDKLILEDLKKLQKDLIIAEKNKKISKKQFSSQIIKSSKITYDLTKLIKKDQIIRQWAKWAKFCNKHKIKLSTFLWTAALWFALISTPNQSIHANVKHKVWAFQVVENQEIKKSSYSFSSYRFEDFETMKIWDKTFNDTKSLYSKFMNQTLSLWDNPAWIEVSREYVQDFIKAEIMYNRWTSTFMNEKLPNSTDEKKSKLEWKIQHLSLQKDDFLKYYYNLETWLWNTDSFSFKKHGQTISITKKDDKYVISWLEKFDFN